MMMDINWIGVALCMLAVFVIGGSWYGPLFGKAWRKASGLSEEMKGGHKGRVFGSAAVAGSVAACAMGALIGPAPDLMRGIHYGIVVGVDLVTMSFVINYLFANRSFALLLIGGGITSSCSWRWVRSLARWGKGHG
jgi:hypothetical protein